MSASAALAVQLAKMLILMLAGVLLYKKKIIDPVGIGQITNILLFLATPCLIITSFDQAGGGDVLSKIMAAFAISIGIYAINTLMALILIKDKNPVHMVAIILSNGGYMGIPLVAGIYGTAAVAYVAPFVICFHIFCWTIGTRLMTGTWDSIHPSRIFMNPNIIAIILGFIVLLSPLSMPGVIMDPIRMMSEANSPMAMLVLGSYLADSKIRKIFSDMSNYRISFYRLILLPLVLVVVLRLLPGSLRDVIDPIFIVAMAPCPTMLPMLAMLYKKDTVAAAEVVSVSTILCLATMPLLLKFTELIIP